MKENKLSIIIKKTIKEVFEFTTNPKNTHLWIELIEEEQADAYPPQINTQYKNRGGNTDWDIYKVSEFKQNKLFTLSDLEENYNVRYSYKKLDTNKTEMTYFEWMKNGELKNPYTKDVLLKLKSIMEN